MYVAMNMMRPGLFFQRDRSEMSLSRPSGQFRSTLWSRGTWPSPTSRTGQLTCSSRPKTSRAFPTALSASTAGQEGLRAEVHLMCWCIPHGCVRRFRSMLACPLFTGLRVSRGALPRSRRCSACFGAARRASQVQCPPRHLPVSAQRLRGRPIAPRSAPTTLARWYSGTSTARASCP